MSSTGSDRKSRLNSTAEPGVSLQVHRFAQIVARPRLSTNKSLMQRKRTSPRFGNNACSELEETCVSWRIAKVFEVVSGSLPHWSPSGKRRYEPAPRPSSVTAKPSDKCLSIVETFLQDDRIELERLYQEIDRFSESFKTPAHNR
jgi:hypothetical protein